MFRAANYQFTTQRRKLTIESLIKDYCLGRGESRTKYSFSVVVRLSQDDHARRKKLEIPTKLKLGYKRLYPAKSVKYLGVQNWKRHIHEVKTKLNSAKALTNFSEDIIGVNN